MSPLDAIQAQGVARVLLDSIRSGQAPPNLLHQTLLLVPADYRAEFLRVVQKAIEHFPA